MSIHNQTASTVCLAKAMLQGLDRTKEHTLVPTNTLELLLNTLIEIGLDNQTARAVQLQHGSFVGARISGVEGR